MRNDMLNMIINAIPDSVMIVDSDFKILAANERALSLLKPDEPIDDGATKCHKALHGFHAPCDDTIGRCPIKEVMSTGTSVTCTHCFHRNDDLIHEVHVAPFKEEDGKTVQFMMLCRDITKRREARHLQKQSDLRYQNLFETMAQGVVYQNSEGGITSANPAAQRILGLSIDQMQGRSSLDPRWKAIHEDGSPYPGETHPAMIALSTGEEVKNKVMGVFHPQENRYVWINICAVPQLEPGESTPFQVYTTFEDITMIKQSADDLLESNTLYKETQAILQAAMDQSKAGIAIADAPDGKLRYVNEAGLMIRGKSKQEIVSGVGIDEYVSSWQLLHFDGTPLASDEVPMARALMYGETCDRQFIVRRDGDEDRIVWAHATPVRNDEGEITSAVAVFPDITEQKLAEKENLALERQILQAQKTESLGVLAGGVAHDFNNLLMGILGNADLALMSMTPETPGRENICDIQTAAERAADLAKQMLAYSGKGRFVVNRIDLEILVKEMVHLLEISISKKAVLRYDLGQNVPPVEADATQVRQIVMNLVINASDSIGYRSGVISIRTGAMECDREYLNGTYLDNELPEGAYSYFEISDTGSGMDKETIDKMFDPFFTTKFTGRGLGLAAVLGIVRGHKGAIKVYSERGKGTTFKVLFPIKEGRLSSVEQKKRDSVISSELEGKTAFIVDDEETVRTVCKQMLEKLGLVVVTAQDGREALEIFKEDPDKFDYIILDLTMPHMNGEETFREMRRIQKEVIVLLSSGYNEQELFSRFAAKGFAGFIQKPYRTAKLKEKLLASHKRHA
ncbi:MAG: PAS domain-containing protein [Deltaproteobacteria bacterium]|nr:PAS domain-containing protein [Deltaproteobacteria bacterium]